MRLYHVNDEELKLLENLRKLPVQQRSAIQLAVLELSRLTPQVVPVEHSNVIPLALLAKG